MPFPTSLNIYQALWPYLLQCEIQQEDYHKFFPSSYDFMDRFILTVDLSDLSIPLPVKLKILPFHLSALWLVFGTSGASIATLALGVIVK